MMENVLSYLEEKWKQLTAFSRKEELKDKLWKEIVERYTEPKRYYHNLTHIGDMFQLLDKFITQIKQPALVGFSIFYHDIIYDTFRQDNEEQSVAKAQEHLQQLNINKSLLQNVEEFILATKTHEVPADYPLENDLSFFLDFDVAVLGIKWEDYFRYSHNIRREYSQYTDAIYKAGRKQALQQLDSKPFLFYTFELQELYQQTARENINKELNLL